MKRVLIVLAIFILVGCAGQKCPEPLCVTQDDYLKLEIQAAAYEAACTRLVIKEITPAALHLKCIDKAREEYYIGVSDVVADLRLNGDEMAWLLEAKWNTYQQSLKNCGGE